ncbi:MAG TPA: DNA-formamidopyrimidine glycosylase family protein [Solirubrobacteraceae bacterium]
MPEGDALARAANTLRPVLVGETPSVATQRFRAERVDGREVLGVDAYGKHLFVDFGELKIHSHLGMVGAWRVDRPGGRPWLTLTTPAHTVTQHRGTTLELLTEARRRQLVGRLGPDILGDAFDAGRAIRRLREDDPTRPIGDALLNQRTVAGIGNMWKAEACWAVALDPWRPAARVSDDELHAVLTAARERMQAAVARPRGGHAVYRRNGRQCERCGTRIRVTGQGDDNRATYWCPGCQT